LHHSVVLHNLFLTQFAENEASEVVRLAVFEVHLQQFVDILHRRLELPHLHETDGSPQQQRHVVLLAPVSMTVKLTSLIVTAHQPQTVAFANIGDVLAGLELDSPIEVTQRLLVVLHLEEELSTIDEGLVVSWVILDALVQLSKKCLTIASVSSSRSVFL
jgi:hypothetical protein